MPEVRIKKISLKSHYPKKKQNLLTQKIYHNYGAFQILSEGYGPNALTYFRPN